MRIVGIIVGFAVALVGLPFLLMGLGIVAVVGDLSGFAVPLRGFEPPPQAVAIVSPEIGGDNRDLPSAVREASVTVRVVPGPDTGPLFIGLAPGPALRPYLRRAPVAVLRIRDTSTGESTDPELLAEGPPDPQVLIRDQELQVDLPIVNPNAVATQLPPPTDQGFWTRTIVTDGTEPFTVSLGDFQGGGERVVLMRADGKPGIAASAELRFRVPILQTIGWWILGIALLVVLAGLALAIGLLIRGSRGDGPAAPGATTAPDATRPAVDTTPADAAPRPAVDTTPPDTA